MNMGLRNKKFGFKRFINSFKNSFSGLRYAYLNEQSMFIHALATILSIILGFVLKISLNEWIIVILFLLLIMVLELINTAIEAVCDAFTLEKNELIKIAKDTSSASVFIACVLAFIVGLSIFLPKILLLGV